MPAPTEAPEPELVRRVKAQRARHQRRGRLARGLVVVAGFLLVLGGAAMLVLPGPAFVVIPVGLAVLSLEFAWAERLLERSLVQAARARRSARESSPRRKAVVGAAVAVAASAFVVLAVRYDIPLVPVL